MPPGEFSGSSVSSVSHFSHVTHSDSATGSYLPSAFIGQSIGIDQVGDIWVGDSRTTSYRTRCANEMYDIRPPPPHRSRIILIDGLIKKVQFIGNIYRIFYNSTHFLVTLCGMSVVPDLDLTLFCFTLFKKNTRSH